MPHVHLDREGDRDLRAGVVDRLPAQVGHPGHMDEQVVGPDFEVAGRLAGWTGATLALGELVQDRANPERRQDVRRDLEFELAPDRPGLLVDLRPEIDLAAHDHGDELIGRGEPLLVDAERVLRIGVVRRIGSGSLEIAEGGAASRIEQGLDGGVRMLRRVMNLRDVVHRRDAVIELAESAEQLVDVHVLRTIDGGKLVENKLEVSGASARCAGAVVDQHPVGEKAAKRRLELVMVRIDEAGHDDAPARVDRFGSACRQVRSDGENGLALDQHVSLCEIAYLGVHRHHRTAADDVAPARLAAVRGRIRRARELRRGRSRCEQIDTRGGNARRCRSLEKIAP